MYFFANPHKALPEFRIKLANKWNFPNKVNPMAVYGIISNILIYFDKFLPNSIIIRKLKQFFCKKSLLNLNTKIFDFIYSTGSYTIIHQMISLLAQFGKTILTQGFIKNDGSCIGKIKGAADINHGNANQVLGILAHDLRTQSPGFTAEYKYIIVLV